MDLFQKGRQNQIEQESPLANRMRPRTLDEFVGQEHIVGPGRLLRRAIEADQLSSLIFYGPPGAGKTTLARIIANTTESHFITINAVLAGVKEIRQAIEEARERRDLHNQRTTLFVDEVHRWNRAQQDALLPHVENGTIILVGATTENPYFEVNKALVSRSRIFQLRPLEKEDLREIAQQALRDKERGYGALDARIGDEALEHLVDVANGDARGVLNALELAVETTPPDEDGAIIIDLGVAEESIQRRAVLYDKDGDVHYDTISAFIKSLRGSDPDAALYWMAKMVYAGEDPRFIFRRMAILAGEDVGLADPNAINVVMSCWQAFERIGMPEGAFPLAEATLYLATCPKSNSSLAFFDALRVVEEEREADVPGPLKDANRDKEGFGHGRGYLYPHAYREHWVAQQYLPKSLQGKVFYEPGEQGYERHIAEQVARRREAQLAAMVEAGDDWRLRTGGETLTTGPSDRGRDMWLQRVVDHAGRGLEQIRDRIFELAHVQRHHLVLDLNAGSGLLTWEAVRRAPEGGVWALTPDPQAGEALREQASGPRAGRLPELLRPTVLVGEPRELSYLLLLRGEDAIHFDRVISRNPLVRFTLEPAVFQGVAPRLRDDGLFVFSQAIPQHGQRLYDLIDWPESASELHDRVVIAEEAIYDDTSDPLVCWDVHDLEQALHDAGFGNVFVQKKRHVEERRLTERHLARWFQEEPLEEGRPSYRIRLHDAGLSDDDVDELQTLYRQQLRDETVEWNSLIVFVVAEK